jgi:hypothetical protein
MYRNVFVPDWDNATLMKKPGIKGREQEETTCTKELKRARGETLDVSRHDYTSFMPGTNWCSLDAVDG